MNAIIYFRKLTKENPTSPHPGVVNGFISAAGVLCPEPSPL